MLGRYQPWHKGHQALLDRALEENEQVVILVRDMATDENNPFTAEEVKKNIIQNLALYAGEVKVQTVPNITHITYGRDVGYTIAQETFDADIEAISATNIRKENAGQ
ncbi:cytidyltransferase [archaeon]|nr:cytidyltransferase [archaeon]